MSWPVVHFKETNQDVKNSDYLKMQSVVQSKVICLQKWAMNAHEKWPGLGRVHRPLSKQVSSSSALWVFRGAERAVVSKREAGCVLWWVGKDASGPVSVCENHPP